MLAGKHRKIIKPKKGGTLHLPGPQPGAAGTKPNTTAKPKEHKRESVLTRFWKRLKALFITKKRGYSL